MVDYYTYTFILTIDKVFLFRYYSTDTFIMSPEQKARYLEIADTQIERTEEARKIAEHARNTSDSKMQSRYDTQRENFNVEVNLHTVNLIRLRQFRDVVENARQSWWIESGAVFSVHFFDTKEELTELLYSPVSVKLPGVNIVTPESPLGKAVDNKPLMHEFSYRTGPKTVEGIIIKIE